MNIKQRVQLNTSVILIIIAVIAGVFFVRSLSLQQTQARMGILSEITRETVLLSSKTQDYINFPSIENQVAWRALQRKIQSTLYGSSLSTYKDHVAFRVMFQSNNAIKALFEEITQTAKSPSGSMRQEKLQTDILSHVKNFVAASATMEKIIVSENALAERRTSLALFIVLEILFAVAVGVGVYMMKTVSDPLSKLISTVKRVAGGNVSGQAPIKGEDEIATLGREFNSMWARISSQTKELKEEKAKDEVVVNKLGQRIIELEDARKAMANLLQDFDEDQRNLAEGKAKDDAFLENIGDGMIVVDKDKKIMIINKAAENLLELKREDVLGKRYDEVFQNQDMQGNLIPPERRPITYVLETGNAFRFPRVEGEVSSTRKAAQVNSEPVFYVRKSGTKFPVALIITPVVVSGEIIGAVDIFRDITKEKEIEKLRIDFLALASHQLRTPLSGVKWLVETIRRGITGEINPKQKEYLDQIYGANERMIALVYDMLDVLKLESSDTPINKSTILVTMVYKDLLAALSANLKKEGRVVHDLLKEDSPIEVETDVELLKLIMECFVSNALHYSIVGQEVFIDAKEEADSVVLSVKDDGIGIPKVESNRIFEKFYRASNAKEYIPEGTGLGLYRATLIAEKIHAEITFESIEGKGTTFYLKLPKQNT